MKEGWTYKKLGEVANFLSGYTPKKNELYPNGDIPYFKVAEMNLLGNEKKLIYTSQFLKETNKIYPKGAIVFPKNGGAVYTEKKRILAQDSVIDLNSEAVVANEDLISTLYLYCLFNHIKISKFDKGGGLPSLDIKRMQEYIVPVPPLSEQQRIVKQLDEAFAEIDTIKAAAEKQLSEAKALFQKALSKAMTPKEGWEEKKLGEFAYMKAGNFVKANEIYTEYKEGLYPCYGGNGFRGYVKEPNHEGNFCLIGRQGALCGCINIANGVFRTTEHAVIVKPYKPIPTLLVYYMLVNLKLNQYATGAAQPGLSINYIAENVRIPIPPLSEQQRIVEELDELAENVKEIEKLNNKLTAECDAMKQALLRQVFE